MQNQLGLPDADSGVSPQLRKGGKPMVDILKRKLRGFPTGNLSLRIGS
jgi:hypothetical protein